MRFQVRASHSELGPVLYKVVDTRDGFRHIAMYSRAQLAETACARFNAEARAALFGAAQQVGR